MPSSFLVDVEDITTGASMVRLIIADDHAVVRQALCDMLGGKGRYNVVGQAGDGEELLNVLNGSKADLVIMDVQMPKLDGILALERLKSNPECPPILVLSADESERNVRASLKAGAKGFVPKNAGPEELEFAINSIMSGKTYLSPSVTQALMNGGGTVGNGSGSPLDVLTKREVEIMQHLADGKPNRIIGKLLHISTRTVDTHRSNILKKLGLRTNAELVKLAIATGLIAV